MKYQIKYRFTGGNTTPSPIFKDGDRVAFAGSVFHITAVKQYADSVTVYRATETYWGKENTFVDRHVVVQLKDGAHHDYVRNEILTDVPEEDLVEDAKRQVPVYPRANGSWFTFGRKGASFPEANGELVVRAAASQKHTITGDMGDPLYQVLTVSDFAGLLSRLGPDTHDNVIRGFLHTVQQQRQALAGSGR